MGRMEVVKRQKLNEIVARQIKRHIMDKGLRPGDRLPTEQEMAETFGVSRMSVREATKALSFLGIIRSAPRRGLTVGEVDMSRLTEYLGFHLAINNFPKAELLETRIVIETGGLAHTAQRMCEDPSIYKQLNELNRQMKESKSNEDRIALDIQFHRQLLESSGLIPLVAFNDLLQIFFNRFRQSVLDGEWELGVQGHQKVINALRDRKVEAATAALRKHIEYHKTSL